MTTEKFTEAKEELRKEIFRRTLQEQNLEIICTDDEDEFRRIEKNAMVKVKIPEDSAILGRKKFTGCIVRKK